MKYCTSVLWILLSVTAVLPVAVPFLSLAEAIRPEDNAALIPLPLEQESLAARLNGMLKCPVCRNQSLASSSSFIAEEMKREIRRMVAQGKSEDEIIAFYVERYTDWVLLLPPTGGVNWFLYLLPLSVLLVAVGGVGFWLRSQGREADEHESDAQHRAADLDKEALRRARELVEKELAL